MDVAGHNNNGGIERFKIGKHGIGVNFCGLIGFIKDDNIVEVPVADDKIQNRINSCLSGKISKSDFLKNLTCHETAFNPVQAGFLPKTPEKNPDSFQAFIAGREPKKNRQSGANHGNIFSLFPSDAFVPCF